MGVAFVALKRGRGQGGFEGASPQRAVTEKPTQPPAPFQCNPQGSRQRLPPFNQWFLGQMTFAFEVPGGKLSADGE